MQTLKLRYEASEDDKMKILSYQKQFSNCMHVIYNRLKEGKSLKQCRDIAKSLNNIDLLNSWLICCAIGEAQLHLSKDKVIFGGKKNFILRAQNKISRSEFLQKRISPIYVCGEATHYHGNRKFAFHEDMKSITFKPNKKLHIELKLAMV